MPRPNTILGAQAREMVYDVYCFMEKEAKTEKETVNRTAEATKTSERTVRRIVKEGRNSEHVTVFRTPGQKRNKKKPITDINTFDQYVIRTCVLNYHVTNKELPTAEKLRKKLKKDINFNGSERSLRRILNNLGFRWEKTENNRQLVLEKTNIKLLRIEFLENLIKYRQEGRPIIYTYESYIDSSHSGSTAWSDGSLKGLKKPISKGQRIMILHAGSEAGYVPNALLLFKSGTESGDFHDNINYENYIMWLCSQLIPNLPPNAVLVIGNASYHNKQDDPAPTSNAKKVDMHRWLAEKGIAYEESMLKPQLYKLIKLYNEQHQQKYSIDQILEEHNHSVLRLPPYHPDLNPIEMVWATIKVYVTSKIITWDVTSVMELVQEKVSLMGADEWSKLCEKVKKIEADYIESDHVVDLVTEQVIIYASDDKDASSYESDESYIEDEEPTPCTSSTHAPNFNLMPRVTLKSDRDKEGEDEEVI